MQVGVPLTYSVKFMRKQSIEAGRDGIIQLMRNPVDEMFVAAVASTRSNTGASTAVPTRLTT